jgi:YidC/Oxa1 family membrane protein insertase
MDKNSKLGIGLLIALLFGYLYFNQKMGQVEAQQKITDSIANAKLNPVVIIKDTIKPIIAVNDTNKIKAETIVENKLENEDVVITFTNKGAMPSSIMLKKYKTATPVTNRQALYVFNKTQNSIDFNYNSAAGAVVHTKELLFTPTATANTISYITPGGISITYTLPSKGYMMDINIKNNGSIGANQNLNIDWNSIGPNTEYDHKDEMQYNLIAYNETEDGTDYDKLTSEQEKEFKKGVKWFSFKQHYFNTTLLSKTNFVSGKAKANSNTDTNNAIVATLTSTFVHATNNGDVNLQLYSGPNDYEILKSYKNDMQEIIPLGYGFMQFVKYINKAAIMPIFNFLIGHIQNYGIVILLLTLIMRLLLAPIMYKSYVSGAKMKLLKPELDELKAKFGGDQQAMGVKQMELYRSAGVNPLGGCIPQLLQLPIFFALLSFFPNAIQLRQQPFLWAKDLSTFDSIAHIPNIPFYGDHISLFTLLFVVTQLVLAITSMSLTQGGDQNNPMLKYLPFIMPVMFLGIFNKLPASLTFYYFISNLFTILLQYFIQNVVLNHDKLRAQIDESKAKGPKQSKLMEKMAEMQKQNEERMKKGK